MKPGHAAERLIYIIAGLPIAARGASLPGSPAAKEIRCAFAHLYWHPRSVRDAIELSVGLLLAPLAVPLAALWFTARNGPIIRAREGIGLTKQFREQLGLYCWAGVVGPWYYIFSLHRDGILRAPTFLQRCETKRGIYSLLRSKTALPMGDKKAFSDLCALAKIPCVASQLVSDAEAASLPDCDLFVKPRTGSGGKGAERWDRVEPRTWSNGRQVLGDNALLDHFRSRRRRSIIQKRVLPHPAIEALTSGALPTVRALTILNEHDLPELVATVFRMSFGARRTVDNIHAGGIACAVSLEDGALGIASDLGADARLGWHEFHPTTGARIEGTRLPYWKEVCALALRGHQAFTDRLMIGWDIAITASGPIVIEGNRGPDMDLMQRFMEFGFCHDHRFTDLIAYHLRTRTTPKAPLAP